MVRDHAVPVAQRVWDDVVPKVRVRPGVLAVVALLPRQQRNQRIPPARQWSHAANLVLAAACCLLPSADEPGTATWRR